MEEGGPTLTDKWSEHAAIHPDRLEGGRDKTTRNESGVGWKWRERKGGVKLGMHKLRQEEL